MFSRLCKFILLFIAFLSVPLFVNAAALIHASDSISTSAPGAVANHTIQFTTTNAIPASGKIVITPEVLAVSIPVGFSFNDVDLAVATSSPYIFTDRILGASATGAVDGVAVTTGTNGNIIITLNSSNGIAAGETIQIEFGVHSSFGGNGIEQFINTTTLGSYRIDTETQNPSTSAIDASQLMFAIVNQVTISNEVQPRIPTILNGLPTGELLSGTVSIVMSVETDIGAYCKYNTLPNIPYASSTDFFTTGFNTVHMVLLTGFVDDSAYTYYIRCEGGPGQFNVTDYVLSFTIEATPGPGDDDDGGSILTGGGSGFSGTGGGLAGGNFAQKAKVIFDGWGPPLSTITLLKDGTKENSFPVGSDGHFNSEVTNLDRGTYTFSIYSVDTDNRQSTTYTTTIAIISDTVNSIANIFIPPTIELEKDTLDPGEDVVVFGQAAPNTIVEAFLNTQGQALDGNIYFATSSVSAAGKWSIAFDTTGFALDTYELKARIKFAAADSDFSKVLYIGLGGAPDPDFGNNADLNQDGFVNITDFSILLFWWGGDGGDSSPPADINRDGKVSLTDFSIMIFYWTG